MLTLFAAWQAAINPTERMPVQAHIVGDSNLNFAQIIFYLLAAIVVGGAIMTITRRNMVAAVMWLVATFFGLAGLYALLYAHLLAVLQVLVYAGAIMVLFVFVVMVLNRDELRPAVWQHAIVRWVFALPALGLLLYMLASQLKRFTPVHRAAPPASFGTVAEVGQVLLTDYLFAFEAISVVLLVAVIATVVIAKGSTTHKTSEQGPIS